MERTAWTDERLDDFSRRMDAGFERVIVDLRELRADVGGLRTEMREEIGGVRGETRQEIGGLRGELGGKIDALQATLLRVGGAMIVALIGVIAAVLARG